MLNDHSKLLLLTIFSTQIIYTAIIINHIFIKKKKKLDNLRSVEL